MQQSFFETVLKLIIVLTTRILLVKHTLKFKKKE